MTDAPSNNNPDPAGGGNPDPNGGGNPNPNPNPAPAAGGDLDLSTLPPDQLQKVLENPNLWKLPRVQELVKSSQDLKKLQDEQKTAEEKRLEEQNEHKTLAEQRKGELETANATIQTMRIDQALTTKLVPEGVVDIEAALKLADRSKIEVGDDGSVKGIDDVINSLKTDKAYLFGKGGGPTLGGPTNPGNQPSGPAKFKRSQLQDNAFYQEHRKEILEAQKAGLIEDDLTAPANQQR